MAHELYDNAAEYKVQREFASDVAIRRDALPYLHPPFEALFFVPFTYLSYSHAFILWDLINLGMLAAVAHLLQTHVPHLQSQPWALGMFASVGFFPIFLTFLQGQDSIALLMLYTLTFVCLNKNAEKLAGLFLGMGLFRPQLVLPFLVLWLMRGNKKILYGFVPTAAVLVLASLATVGTGSLLSYPGYVLHVNHTMAQGAVRPSDMPNLRGLFYVLAGGRFHALAFTILFSISILLLSARLFQMREAVVSFFYWKFSLAVVATVAVSYYCLGHDLSILLLPIALVIGNLQTPGKQDRWPWILINCSVIFLFFSPLELLLLRGNHLALMGVAVLLLLSGILAQILIQSRSLGSIPPNCEGLFDQAAIAGRG